MDITTEKIKNECIIREATVNDLPGLVRLHVTSWNHTYPNYFPKPTYQLREMQWRKLFDQKENDWFCYVVITPDNKLAGFATGSRFYDAQLPYAGQLNKIHFYPKYHRMGWGTKLVGYVVRHFLKHGIHSMILFADPANPHTRFYDKLSGIKILDNEGKFQGAYGWENLKQLEVICGI